MSASEETRGGSDGTRLQWGTTTDSWADLVEHTSAKGLYADSVVLDHIFTIPTDDDFEFRLQAGANVAGASLRIELGGGLTGQLVK